MTTEKMIPDYAKMVVEAEAAVASVKDPELRRVAFDRILSAFLEQPSVRPKAGARETPTPKTISRGGQKERSKRGPKAYLEALVDDGFFKTPRTIADAKAELANNGYHIALSSLSGPLQSLTQNRKLRRQKTSAKAGAKSTYAYSNW